MKRLFATLLSVLFSALVAFPQLPTTLEDWAQRLKLFGEKIPQEEVFVHMDNTSYYLGDTIYYKAYMRLSDGRPSELSRLLYAELYNQDGYLVERQKIEMTNGQGHGSFVLPDTLYGGYYELRAYTRWQLNWGRTEHPHTKSAEAWFFSEQLAKDYYRDYDKLYSRVFPVYDHPLEPGDYARDMTMRPMQRVFKAENEKPKPQLQFYPEGGYLVAGAPCRVAFEANDEDGRHLKGELLLPDGSTAPTVSRGRGSFLWDGTSTKATFRWSGGEETFPLPRPVEDGVALQARVESDGIHVKVFPRGSAAREPLGLTASCHGVQKDFRVLTESGGEAVAVIPLSELPTGVIQLTVFNAEGRIYADRLVFVRQPGFAAQNITFSGVKEKYKPYEPIDLTLHVARGEDATAAALSLAVRDAAHSDGTFDSGNILTEMLLSSQIRGFVEKPDYYFEADDEEHREALDLLLLVQGWRRYDWKTMAVPGAFALVEPYERTERLSGQVMPYMAEEQANLLSRISALTQFVEGETQMETQLWDRVISPELLTLEEKYIARFVTDPMKVMRAYASMWGMPRLSNYAESDLRRTARDGGTLNREVLLHAEFVQPGVDNGLVDGEMTTFGGGRFRIDAPRFYQACHFSLAASDSSKWKPGYEKIWVDVNEDSKGQLNYPEFYVRLDDVRPRFVKPYTFYQTALLSHLPAANRRSWDDAILMQEVQVGGRHGGKRTFDARHPAFVMDALEAFNYTIDAGLCPGYYIGARRFVDDIARAFVGDMGLERAYQIETRIDGKRMGFDMIRFSEAELQNRNLDNDPRAGSLRAMMEQSANVSPAEKDVYDHLPRLDEVYVYTDYAPRREGDPRYEQSNQPTVVVDLRRFKDGGQRMTWRDRRLVLRGFAVCEDFYRPDYSRHTPSSPTDYRRTLYWNPDLVPDADGRAIVRFFNNCRETRPVLSAEGMTAGGQPLTGISYPEER